MNIAIITARGGSKRIPGKNIKEFWGKPMIAWPISVAKQANIFDRIIVSTDSEKIAEIAKAYGAEVPFMRPPELSDDHTPTAPVFAHAIETLMRQGKMAGMEKEINFACCIYPTTPFIQPHDLIKGLEAVKAGAPSAISITTFAFPILRAFKLDKNGTISFQWPEYELTRSQDLPEFYHDAGQFYWVNTDAFLKSGHLVMPGTVPVILPRKRVQDLDTPEDWDTAELMANILMSEAKKEKGDNGKACN